MSTKDKKQDAEPTVKVKLLHNHEHARVQYKKDDEIGVPQSTAAYMEQQGIAKPV